MGGKNILLFPQEYTKHKHAKIHFLFIIRYAKLAGIEVKLIKSTSTVYVPSGGYNSVSCELNKKQIIFDYSDFSRRWVVAEKYPNVPVFKVQCPSDANKPENMFSCGPIFAVTRDGDGLNDYFKIKQNFNYQCTTEVVLNKQIAHGNASVRRKRVQTILSNNYDAKYVDSTVNTTNKKYFWKAHENCLSAVCIPGAAKDSLDRGQYELIGLGVCVISPHIPVLFPWDKKLIPNKHYINIKHDYSDLIEKINWCKDNKDKCTEIGHQGRELFDEYSTPDEYWRWILQCTNNFYKEIEI